MRSVPAGRDGPRRRSEYHGRQLRDQSLGSVPGRLRRAILESWGRLFIFEGRIKSYSAKRVIFSNINTYTGKLLFQCSRSFSNENSNTNSNMKILQKLPSFFDCVLVALAFKHQLKMGLFSQSYRDK